MPTKEEIENWKWRAEYFRDMAKVYMEQAEEVIRTAKEYLDRADACERRVTITTPQERT